MRPGIYLAHKAIGPSSFATLRAIVPKSLRSCHGGTLDPFASGLLLVLIEPATQLFDLLHDIPKVYDVTIAWGTETDNGDPTGQVVARGDASALEIANLRSVMQSHVGWRDQVPPATSAGRIDGERAYVRVHRGENVVLPAKSVYLHSAEWLGHDLPRTSRVCVTVRGGYYVRSLVRDLGREVGCRAHVGALQRRSIGAWNDPGPGGPMIAKPQYLPWLATRRLDETEVRLLKGGASIDVGDLQPPAWAVPLGFPPAVPYVGGIEADRFNFILELRDGRLWSRSLLRGGILL